MRREQSRLANARYHLGVFAAGTDFLAVSMRSPASSCPSVLVVSANRLTLRIRRVSMDFQHFRWYWEPTRSGQKLDGPALQSRRPQGYSTENWTRCQPLAPSGTGSAFSLVCISPCPSKALTLTVWFPDEPPSHS